MSNIYCFKLQYNSIVKSEMLTSICGDAAEYIRFEYEKMFFYFNSNQFTEYQSHEEMIGSNTVYLVTQKIFDDHYWVHWLSYDFEYTFTIPPVTTQKSKYNLKKIFWRMVTFIFIALSILFFESGPINLFLIVLFMSLFSLALWFCNDSLLKYYSSKEVSELYGTINNISINMFTIPGNDRFNLINIDELITSAPKDLTIVRGAASVSSVIKHSAGSFGDGTYVYFSSVYMTCNNNDICFRWKRYDSHFILRWNTLPPFISTGDDLILFFSEWGNKEININQRIAQGRTEKESKEHIYPAYIYNKTDGVLYRSWFATPIKEHPYFSSLNKSYPCYQKE
ncbi:hypothetical protein ACQK5W_14220 [Pantoea sp. FN060301]|uniref:hypothetical protein n=1 Tax=Pantoea sp. FN060301 TaxID=3420380 RepID=UPI003D1732B1